MFDTYTPIQADSFVVYMSQTDVFKMENFFVTDVDKNPLAVAYMGTLRKSSEEVFKDVEKRLQSIEGECLLTKACCWG